MKQVREPDGTTQFIQVYPNDDGSFGTFRSNQVFAAKWLDKVNTPQYTLTIDMGNGTATDVSGNTLSQITDTVYAGFDFELPPVMTITPPEDLFFSHFVVYETGTQSTGASQTMSAGETFAAEKNMTAEAVYDTAENLVFTVTYFDPASRTEREYEVHPGLYTLKACMFTPPSEEMVFGGWWMPDYDYLAYAGEEVPVLENIYMEAEWVKGTPTTITYHASNGTDAIITEQAFIGVSTQIAENTFALPGFHFVGWEDADEIPYEAGEWIVLEDELDLYACWAPNEPFRTLTFDPNNGGLDVAVSLSGAPNGIVITVPAPDALENSEGEAVAFQAPANSTFAGWNTKADGTGKAYAVGGSLAVDADITLYAQWSKGAFTVTFNANGGENTMDVQTYVRNVPQALKANAFTRVGYTFTGWNTAADGNGTGYTDGQELTLTQDLVLFAQWQIKSFTVKFDGNGADNTMSDVTKVYGDKFVPENGFNAPEGKELAGWSDGKTTYAVDAEITVTDNMTLTAVWETKTYAVNFKTDEFSEGMTQMAAGSVKHGEQYTLPECTMGTPSEGRVFSHWDYNNVQYQPGDKLPAAEGAMDVFARWKAKTYTVVYQDNAGNVKLTLNGIQHGTVLDVKDPSEWNLTAEEDGYKFNCWIAYENGKAVGEAFTNPENKFPVLGNYTLVPNWVTTGDTTYTLTLNMNGGNPVASTDPVPAGAYFELPPAQIIAHPDDLEFLYFDVNGTHYNPGDIFPATGNMTAVAIWKTDCTVKFDKNGGTGEMASVTVAAGSSYTLPTCAFTAPQGQTFVWWTANDTDYQPGDSMTVAADVTIKAVWEPTEYTVKLIPDNGGLNETITTTVERSGSYTLPECPFRAPANKQFSGWLCNYDIMEEEPGDQHVDIHWNLEFTAVWEDLVTYTLTYDANGGKGEMVPQIFAENVPQGLSANLFGKPGYTFTGWNTKADGTGTPYTDLQANVKLTQATTLYAQWKINTYTITFEGGDAPGAMQGATRNHGESYVLPENGSNPPENGFAPPVNYEFKAWNVNGKEYKAGDSVPVTENLIVKPVWNWIEYTVRFEANGGSGTMEPITVHSGTSFNAPLCGFAKPEGQKLLFDSWQVDDELSKGSYKVGEEIYVYSDITLKACWMPSEYTITYKSGTGSDAITHEVPIATGAPHTLLENMFEKPEGKLFRCWLFLVPPQYTQMEEHDPGDVFDSVSSNLTFIADWETMKYQVSFDANGGSGSMASEVLEHNAEFVIPDCEFDAPVGHTFSGWDITGEYEMKDGSLIVKGSVTLKAMWAPVDLAITFELGELGGDKVTLTKKYGEKFRLPYVSELSNWGTYLDNYVFQGWSLNDGSPYKGQGEEAACYTDTTYTAKWVDRWYTVTIKDSNESAKPHSVTVEYNDSYTLKDAAAYGFKPKNEKIHVFDSWVRTSDGKVYQPGDTIENIKNSMAIEAKWTFGQIVEVKDEVTGEVVKTEVQIEVKAKPEEVDQNDANLMNTSNPKELPEQLGNMLATLQVNTANAAQEGGVVIETMQDVVDALHESINGSQSVETTEPEYPVENIVVHDIVPVIEVEVNGKTETIEIKSKDMLPDDRGVEVPLEIPAGTNPATYQYKITHMLTQDAWDNSGKKAGDIETLTVHRYDEKYLYVWMKNFSPVAVAYKEKPVDVPNRVIDLLPDTSDPSSLLGWITLLGASGAGLKLIRRKKK